jgi:hypothetical protein
MSTLLDVPATANPAAVDLANKSAIGKMPQFLELKDKFGNNLFFGNGGDVRFAATPLIPDFRQQLKDVRQLELRSDDVIVVGYPKSGQLRKAYLYLLKKKPNPYLSHKGEIHIVAITARNQVSGGKATYS